ncbi:nuclear transport factor 2 family protein [Sandaracinobacter sp. RS1-74]|uniref:YybH family protein n=1 Tax=Sandaracinobacteroides sayramensis TaxID=2913411 RepID=UPI001EDB465E|nr:nuclear transport factor 2 family protein [Sandaracinobacteroides sayramensis]MCG2842621.1 nuclear transport factor 2 family protein [Sandaracinobacteroides sayramensis]
MPIDAPDDIKRIIKERSDIFERHFAAGDAAALVRDYYVPDSMAPLVSAGDGPAILGHAAITSLFEAFTAGFEKARQVPRFISAGTDLAYEVSNSYLTPKGGGDEVEYRYVATWRRCDDGWRVEADFFAPGPLV